MNVVLFFRFSNFFTVPRRLLIHPRFGKNRFYSEFFFTVYGRFGFEIIGLTLPLTIGQTRFAIERNFQQKKQGKLFSNQFFLLRNSLNGKSGLANKKWQC